ncbi:SPX domain-containing protein 4 [Neltuma alba]|uniref:SPX domain-containing protein 4 n=1 Tax=Neltuma alba TaxID=207710 RepID=UPI0010A3CD6E|nr:SPX domain-containing protein 4-like [Prosopis alba]
MKFGKEFKTHLEETIPEWRDKFLCYKPLKKLIKQVPTPGIALRHDIFQPPIDVPPVPSVQSDADQDHPEPAPRPYLDLQAWFIVILNEELEKFNDFYIDKEEDLVIRFQVLKERIERLKEKSSRNEMYTSESEFSEEMMDIRKDLVTIHGQMVLLKNYSSLNFAGLIKILKKYDKRTGRLLRLPFTQFVLRQPFFTTEPLTRLVHECEENLELLFPLQEEVIQSARPTGDQPKSPVDSAANTSPEASSTLGEETAYLYRSTLAAMKAIRGLQKASSTCNPFSFSTLFSNQDADSTGAVTVENSPADSRASLWDGEDTDEEETYSV